MSLSDIEKDLDKWGYKILDPINKPHHWIRSGGNISSKEMADELMLSSNAACKPYWNTVNTWNWLDIFISNNLDLNRNRTEIVYEHVTRFYIPKLLKVLENKSW
jgi:hypothetical protein